LIFIDSDFVTNVTKLNRVNSRRVLLYMGNSAGVISYGKGKGSDYESAYNGAFKKLKENMVCIHLDRMNSVPMILTGKHNDFRLKIYSQEIGNYWGGFLMWQMLYFAGLTNYRFVINSRKLEPYSMIYAFFQAVTKNVTPRIIA